MSKDYGGLITYNWDSDMASRASHLTFRIRQIPAHVAQFHELICILQYILDHQKPITVHSLASSIDCFEHPPTKVATVTFEDVPGTLSGRGQKEWIFSKSKAGLAHNIIIDTHFRGFTVLNEVDSGNHSMDCIAITGLAGHAYGSWSARGDQTDFMWLRDALPKRFKHVRVISYGYDTQVIDSESFQTIPNLSLALIHRMRSIGLAEHSSKPVLFLAHSLGGIVLKQAMVQLANTPTLETTWLSKVKGVIFFGVPNQGMDLSHLLPMVEHRPNKPLIQSLCKESAYLAKLDEQFFGIALTRNIGLVSIYETHKSQIPEKMPDGSWRRAGPYAILVEPISAIQRGTKETDQYPVNKDHSNLVKFAENEDDLLTVLHFINSFYDVLNRTRGDPAPHQHEADTVSDSVTTIVPPEAQNPDQAHPSQRNAIAASQKKAMIQSILQSINAEETGYRFRAVESAYQSTFEWLFTKHQIGLMDWLRVGKGIFWIRGKPGSGKSTAMKHVYQRHCSCIENVRPRLPGLTEITAKFFFFHRGSSIQKSFEGLMRSLLHQLLSSSEELAEIVLLNGLNINAKISKNWSYFQLDTLWAQILEQQLMDLRITLFLDALDEFEGAVDRIVRFVDRTANQPPHSKTQVRICFTSRPWDIFNDRFSRCQGFQMEDHTQPDMSYYVRDTMYTHDATKIFLFSPVPSEQASAERLITRILQQAQGVFIWVKLVLENLLEARTAGAELEELDQIIAKLPHELEDLYAALLMRVKMQGYHLEAYTMLELLVRAPRPLEIHEFRCIVKCALLPDLQACVQTLCHMSYDMSEAEVDTVRRRVKSRCGGLVEIITRSPKSGENRRPKHIVQLMHQSVKDFVTRPGFKGVLDLPNDPISSENGHSFLSKFGLALIQGAIHSDDGQTYSSIHWLTPQVRERLFNLLADAFRRAERTTGFPQCRLLDSIDDQQFARFFPQERYDNDLTAMMDYRPRQWPIDSRISFAVIAGLSIYLKSKLTSPGFPNAARGLPILHAIVERLQYDGTLTLTESIQFLLDHGADVHATYEGLTPFQSLFRCVDPRMPWSSVNITENMGHVVELLLAYGSDVNADIFYCVDNTEDFLADPGRFVAKALHLTVNCPAMVQLLLEYGANVNGMDADGRTPLDLIATYPGSGNCDENLDEVMLESAAILINNGGRFTEHSLLRGDADDDTETTYIDLLQDMFDSSEVADYQDLVLEQVPILSVSRRTSKRAQSFPRLRLPQRRPRGQNHSSITIDILGSSYHYPKYPSVG